MIAIIDFGAGNLKSIEKALALFDSTIVTQDPCEVESADKVVFPGVGAFDSAMRSIKSKGLDKAIKSAIDDGKPFLGICLGLQLLFSKSEEGTLNGLGIFKEEVVKMRGRKVPQIGWNQIKIIKQTKILNGIKNGSFFYFVHSYCAKTEGPIVAAITEYSGSFPSVISSENVYATQFHPEKSGRSGLKVLKNFARCG